MATLALLALAILAGIADTTMRIPTTVENYPSVVQVDFRSVASGIWGQACAGHIVTSTWIVSSAQCFHGATYSSENRRIRAGSSYRDTEGIFAYVERESNHPTFGLRGFDGDISVVKLLDSLVYDSGIAAGAIIVPDFDYPDSLPVVHLGWGATAIGGSSSSELLESTIYTINIDACEAVYGNLSIPEFVTENMICGLPPQESDEDISSGACQGDLGGPVYHRNEQEPRLILIGIVSWGYGCSGGDFPQVSTRVSSYTQWINETAV